MKNRILAVIAGLIAISVQAQTYTFDGAYLLDHSSGIHYDVPTRALGALAPSNPNPNPYKAYEDRVQQLNTYNTPDAWVRGAGQYAVVTTTSSVGYQTQQTQTAVSVSVQATCYFFTEKNEMVCMTGVSVNGVFTPNAGTIWNKHKAEWAKVEILANPFKQLTFCGGYVTRNDGSRTWKYALDKSWNIDNYPKLTDAYKSKHPIKDGRPVFPS